MRRAFRALTKDRETGIGFTLALCIPYAAFLVWMHVHHEMWRDEIHAWNLARQAQGFWDLVTGERAYEGHPPLWFWYLHIWSWFSRSAFCIQAATAVAATAAAVIFTRFAPFPRYLKVVVLFSYYLGYEYGVVARNYVMGWLLICIFCALYHPIRPRRLLLAITLALLSLTSAYGLILSIVLLAFLVLDQTRFSLSSHDGEPPPDVLSVRLSPRLLTAVAIAAAGILFCVLTVEPPDPNPFSPAFNFNALRTESPMPAFQRFTSAFLPWSSWMQPGFWNMSFEILESSQAWTVVVALALFVAATLALYPSWRLMLVFVVATVGMEVFMMVRYAGSLRHRGHFLLLFIAASWLLRVSFPRRKQWIATALLLGIAPFQVQSLITAAAMDTREVFSGGRETAAFIRKAKLQDLPLVAGPDYMVETVAGYLDRPFIAVETDEVNENVVFHSRRRHFSTQALLNKAISVSRDRKSPVLVVCFTALPSPPAGVTSTELFHSRPGTVGDEIFTVYRLQTE